MTTVILICAAAMLSAALVWNGIWAKKTARAVERLLLRHPEGGEPANRQADTAETERRAREAIERFNAGVASILGYDAQDTQEGRRP